MPRIPWTPLLLLASVSASPIRPRWDASYAYTPLPFDDGFPTPSASQLLVIEAAAHGLLPEGAPGSNITADGATNFQLFSLASIISAVYYDEMQHAIASDAGFNASIPSWIDRGEISDFLDQAKASDELYTLSSVHALGHFNATIIPPCTTYRLPLGSFDDAMDFGIVYQTNLIGMLGDLAYVWGENGDVDLQLVKIINGISASKAMQLAQLRKYRGLGAIQSPFWTYGQRDLTFSYLQTLVDLSSCPNISSIDLEVYPPMTISSTSDASITLEVSTSVWETGREYSVVLLNGASLPAVQNSTPISQSSDTVSIVAAFPFVGPYSNTSTLPDGLSTFVLAKGAGPFDDLTGVVVAGPAFVRVN